MVTDHGPLPEPPPESPDELGSAWEPFGWGCLIMVPTVPLGILSAIALHRQGLSGQVASGVVAVLMFLATVVATRWRCRKRRRLDGWAKRELSMREQRRNLKLGLIFLPLTFFTFMDAPLGLRAGLRSRQGRGRRYSRFSRSGKPTRSWPLSGVDGWKRRSSNV